MGPHASLDRRAPRRTTDDRVVAGVCGGLAERMAVDAVAVRVLFVLGAMVWGLTLVIYGVLWWRLAEVDSPTANPVRPGRLPSVSLAMGAVALTAAGMLALRSLGLLPPDLVVLPLSLAALGVFFLWAGQPLRPVYRPALEGPASHSDAATEAGDPFDPHDPYDLDTPRSRPAGERAPFGSALIGATLLVACLGFLADRADWIDLQWRLLGACLLVVLGFVLIGGSTRGRPSGLMGVGMVLMAALLAATIFQVPLGSGVGARSLRPFELAEIDTHLAGGSLTIDLRDLALTVVDGEPTGADVVQRLDASVAVGDLHIVVPIGVELTVAARSGFGAVTVFDDAATGLSVERTFTSAGYEGGPGQLEVTAVVGLGRVIVEQQQ